MRKLTLSVSSAVTAFLAAPVVLVTPQSAYSQALEEITVTARKTTESLQEVPLAITALSGDDIERLNLQDLADITQQDTSVQFDEGFTPDDTRITIRGLSPTRGRPNAATLVDGIDLTSEAVSNAGGSTLINPRLIDVAAHRNRQRPAKRPVRSKRVRRCHSNTSPKTRPMSCRATFLRQVTARKTSKSVARSAFRSAIRSA